MPSLWPQTSICSYSKANIKLHFEATHSMTTSGWSATRKLSQEKCGFPRSALNPGSSCNIAISQQPLGSPLIEIGCGHLATSKSAATKQKNTTEITPFIVKKAAFNRDRSWAETKECS